MIRPTDSCGVICPTAQTLSWELKVLLQVILQVTAWVIAFQSEPTCRDIFSHVCGD